jgi:hypothetical protein
MIGTILSILGFALLFVVLGLVRRENDRSAGCDRCPEEDEPSSCDTCPLPSDRGKPASGIRLVK